MDETTNTKKKGIAEMAKSIDAGIAKAEEALARSEKNLSQTRDKIKRLKAEIEELKRRKSALFGDKMMGSGITTVAELESLLALHREKGRDATGEEAQDGRSEDGRERGGEEAAPASDSYEPSF